MSTNLIDTVGETAASVLDGLAEAVLGPGPWSAQWLAAERELGLVRL